MATNQQLNQIKGGLTTLQGMDLSSASQDQRAALSKSLTNIKNTLSKYQKDATSVINSGQDEDISSAPDPDEPPSRDESSRSTRYAAAFENVEELFGNSNRPETPSYSDLYEDLRDEFNLDSLEGYVNDLQTEEEEIFAQLRQRRTAERGKPVAMNVITGRIGEAERQESERMDYIARQKSAAVRQLQSANATIENLINFKKLDYDTARNEYNDKFNQKMQLYTMAKGAVDADITDEQRAEERSRANLDIIYGAIGEGKITPDNITDDMLYSINRMEMEAGLPTGFYNNLMSAEPEGEILSTTTRTAGNAKYADVLYKMPDGSIQAKSVYLGASGSGGSGSDGDDKEIKSFREDAAKLIADLDAKKISWGTAFDSLKAQYPNASNELIDAILGGGLVDSDEEAANTGVDVGGYWGRGTTERDASADSGVTINRYGG